MGGVCVCVYIYRIFSFSSKRTCGVRQHAFCAVAPSRILLLNKLILYKKKLTLLFYQFNCNAIYSLTLHTHTAAPVADEKFVFVCVCFCVKILLEI